MKNSNGPSLISSAQDLRNSSTTFLKSELRNKRILLTGPTGLIGGWLLDHWLALKPAASLTLLSHECELADTGSYDYVIHAAKGNLEYLKKIVMFSKRAQVKKFLYLSSGVVTEEAPRDLERLRYYDEKRAQEDYLMSSSLPFEVVSARIFTVCGPHLPLQAPFALSHFIRCALNQNVVPLIGKGFSVRSYLYATDVSQWLWMLLIKGQNQNHYDVGSHEPVAISQVASYVARHFNTVVVHDRASVPYSSYLPKELSKTLRLGLEIKVPLSEAIARTCDWWIANRSEQGRAWSYHT